MEEWKIAYRDNEGRERVEGKWKGTGAALGPEHGGPNSREPGKPPCRRNLPLQPKVGERVARHMFYLPPPQKQKHAALALCAQYDNG